jgi:hypothetical protein
VNSESTAIVGRRSGAVNDELEYINWVCKIQIHSSCVKNKKFWEEPIA